MAKKPVKFSVVDAFTETAFKGNPAAVCILEEERDEKWLQSVATEFNLSETCFLLPVSHIKASSVPRFSLRWFTPVCEVKLCGHATLAAAHTLFSSGLVASNIVEFVTLSGLLAARKIPDNEDQDKYCIELDFPVDLPTEFHATDTSQISAALKGTSIVEIKRTTITDDLLVEVSSGQSLIEFKPPMDDIVKCPAVGIILTSLAPSDSGFDFYSRYFCPKEGINEDPVTGSIHCGLAYYWSKKLGKCDFKAYQASPRGGVLHIHLDEQKKRVLLRGKAVTVMEGCVVV